MKEEGIEILEGLFKNKFGHLSQPPNYYFSVSKIVNRKSEPNYKLRALRATVKREIPIGNSGNNIKIRDILDNKHNYIQKLSVFCFQVFEGKKEYKQITRYLDILIYGDLISERAEEILAELKKVLPAAKYSKV